MKFGYNPNFGIPDEHREKIVLRAEVVGVTRAAAEYKVHVSSIYNWMRARKKQEESK